MKRLLVVVILGAFALVVLPGQCAASYIRLTMKPSSMFKDGKVKVTVAVANEGDEPAKLVRVEARLENTRAVSETKDSLDTNETFRAALDFGSPPSPAGVYTVIIAAHYEDANGYPFSELDSIPLVTVDPDSIKKTLTARLSPATVSGARQYIRTPVMLQSTASTAIQARVTLALAEGFECAPCVLNKSLDAGSSGEITFTIFNRSARSNSKCPVLAVVDYEENGLHHSITTRSHINVLPPANLSDVPRRFWLPLTVLLLVAFAVTQFLRLPDNRALRMAGRIFPYAVIAVILGFITYHIPLSLLMMNTLTVGGDTVAHNYLASHLKEQVFHHGRIVSWANGWWCGFPMFQYYFCLPYLVMSFLSLVIPFNIAFKVVSVAGIFALPISAYASARIMRLPKPGPVLLAIATLPLLFDSSHTKWGVNIYSTFAGMISNSISFPIMLLFIACSWRDADDGRFRFSTVFLLVLLVASHFFTSIIAALTIAILPLLRPKAGLVKALGVLAAEGGIALLLMAWWLVPLIAKRDFSMDFGTNWELSLRNDIPTFLLALLPFAALALPLAIVRKSRFVAVTLWMFAISIFLMLYGYDGVSPVFVNVRLWPFAVYALLALAAAGIGLLAANLKATEIAVPAILIVGLLFAPGKDNYVRSWAEWNYEGLEQKPRWQVFQDLVLPLDGTPGRLANDLNDRNCSIGSSRIFECVPHLIRKPILEGGIVNSAIGSMFSYYIQSETSETCAGAPPIVTPTTFNFTNATKHLELFNVKHFIAVGRKTKEALAHSPDWQFLKESQGWVLYELTTHNGSYVFIPRNQPVFVRTAKRGEWKEASLHWMYTINAIDHPLVFLQPREKETGEPELTIEDLPKYLNPMPEGIMQSVSGSTHGFDHRIWDEQVSDQSISFRTTGIGLPHIVKCTFFPNWKVRGADKVYMVSPCFMLVYPRQEQVELYYGSTLFDNAGRFLSICGLLALCAALLQTRRTRAAVGTDDQRGRV